MSYGLAQTQAPNGYPVSTQEVKDRLRIDLSNDDTVIGEQIAQAVDYCERTMDRQLLPAEWTLYLDQLPELIRLPRPPLLSVTSIRYVDGDGTWQTLAASGYAVRSGREPAQIEAAYGESWPSVRCQADAIEILYRAGYADASAVPLAIKGAIYMHVALLRGDCIQLGMTEEQCKARRDEVLTNYWHGWAFA